MDLRDLKLLLDVVQEGSVQGAANKLRVSRSTLRRRLENLEADVGSQLLVRGVAGVALTPAGAVVAQEGRILLEHSQRMLTRATAREEGATGTVRVILQLGMKCDIRVALAAGLRAVNPELRVVERECEDPLAMLHEPFNLMVYIGAAPPKGDWYSRVIARVPFRLLASPAYLERAGTPKEVADLAAHSLVSWRGPVCAPDVVPLLDGGAAPVTPWFISSNLELVMAAARRQLGIGLGPVFMDNDGLVPVLEDRVGAEVTVRVLSPHASSSDARVRAVNATVDQFLAALPNV